MSFPVFKRITIIGLGLIGSSIARAVRKYKLAGEIIGCDENEISLAFARKENFIDIVDSNLQTAVVGSDLVIIATPPASLGNIAEIIAPYLAHGVIVMDVASVKQSAIDAISPYIPEYAIFIPAHPIAGSEQTGIRAGCADLFVKKRIIITPTRPPAEELFRKLSMFWESMGARVEAMPAEIHDIIYGYMSHLPQLIAFCLEKPLGEFYRQTEDNPVYKTFLRISNSSPELWAEIFELNKVNLLVSLDRYIDVILHVQNELNVTSEGEENQNDEKLVYTILFPRIVASCLVTVVMEAEKKLGISFAKYAGTGFADMVAPTFIAPDADIEYISKQYKLVGNVLGEFILRLKLFRIALSY